MQDYVAELVHLVNTTTGRLLALTDEAASRAPAADRWSPKQILGHLIDSASNNHQRFVRAQLQDDLLIAGYEQEAWVACQGYADAPWEELVGLWRLYNMHLARVMTAAPQTQRLRQRTRYELDGLVWHRVSSDETATLEYVMRDYVAHLRQHLAQILGVDAVESGSGAGAA